MSDIPIYTKIFGRYTVMVTISEKKDTHIFYVLVNYNYHSDDDVYQGNWSFNRDVNMHTIIKAIALEDFNLLDDAEESISAFRNDLIRAGIINEEGELIE